MNKKKFSVILLLLTGLVANAQSSLAKNAVYLEGFGNGGVYSINLERYLSQRFNVRVGFGYWSSEEEFGGEETYITVPVMLNSLIGGGNHKIEVGAGVMFGSRKFESGDGFVVRENSNETIFNLTAVAGYRFQKPSGGLLLRAGLTPFLSLNNSEDPYPDKGLFISGGASIGYVF